MIHVTLCATPLHRILPADVRTVSGGFVLIRMLEHDELVESLSSVEVIYSDLDGTLLGKGGSALTDAAGNTTARTIELLLALKEAGRELVIVTGRNRVQTTEIARILQVQTFIGELGGFNQHGFGDAKTFHFNTGEWADIPEGSTPVKMMDELGIIDHLLELHPGHVERVPVQLTNAREVSTLVYGSLDAELDAESISIDGHPVTIIDNGEISLARHPLEITEGLHVYHVLPRGISKGEAVRADMRERGIEAQATLALGDSCGDLSMAGVCGHFGLVANGVEALEVQEMVERDNLEVYGTAGYGPDGWAEMVSAVLGR